MTSTAEVSPIAIEWHHVTVSRGIPWHLNDNLITTLFTVSDNGYARGLYTLENPKTDHGVIVKFTINATQDRCVVVLGEVSPVQWSNIVAPGNPGRLTCNKYSERLGMLDGVRGLFSSAIRCGTDGRVAVLNLE